MSAPKLFYRTFRIFLRNFSSEALCFVPKHNPVIETDVKLVEDFIARSERIFVLTGAGISTESGLTLVRLFYLPN